MWGGEQAVKPRLNEMKSGLEGGIEHKGGPRSKDIEWIVVMFNTPLSQYTLKMPLVLPAFLMFIKNQDEWHKSNLLVCHD